MNPVTADDIFGLFMFVPIIGGCAISANQQDANLTLFYCMAVFIGYQSLVARHKLTGTTGLYLSCMVTNKDMQDLCAADAIKDV